jgi:hypothetical protein
VEGIFPGRIPDIKGRESKKGRIRKKIKLKPGRGCSRKNSPISQCCLWSYLLFKICFKVILRERFKADMVDLWTSIYKAQRISW